MVFAATPVALATWPIVSALAIGSPPRQMRGYDKPSSHGKVKSEPERAPAPILQTKGASVTAQTSPASPRAPAQAVSRSESLSWISLTRAA